MIKVDYLFLECGVLQALNLLERFIGVTSSILLVLLYTIASYKLWKLFMVSPSFRNLLSMVWLRAWVCILHTILYLVIPNAAELHASAQIIYFLISISMQLLFAH